MNKITIELCKEDRERLDRIADLLEGATKLVITDIIPQTNPAGVAEQPQEATEAPTQERTYIKEETDTAPWEGPKNEAPAPTVSREEVRQTVIRLSNAGKKAEVKDIVTKYATSVSGIPDENLDEAYRLLTALEG